MTSDLETARQKMEVTVGQLHQLEAERLIHTNQIAALEAERIQLIGEKEELQLSSAHWQGQEVMEEEHLEVLKELRERLVTLRSETPGTSDTVSSSAVWFSNFWSPKRNLEFLIV